MAHISFTPLTLANIDEYAKLTAPGADFHRLDAPYYIKTEASHASFIQDLRAALEAGNTAETDWLKLIICDGQIIGMCSWYWRSKETNWLEVGIAIFSKENWVKGIGSYVLPKWIDWVFESHPKIVRIGLTTWSGNIGMLRLAQKIGLQKEACYRDARIVDGRYYDSLSYGITKAEWFKLHS